MVKEEREEKKRGGQNGRKTKIMLRGKRTEDLNSATHQHTKVKKTAGEKFYKTYEGGNK